MLLRAPLVNFRAEGRKNLIMYVFSAAQARPSLVIYVRSASRTLRYAIFGHPLRTSAPMLATS